MPLAKACEAYRGKKVSVLPFYGSGWVRFQPEAQNIAWERRPLDSIPVPPRFAATIVDYCYHDSKILGGVASIEGEAYLEGFRWLGFALRAGITSLEEWDFSQHLARSYCFGIGMTKPRIKPDASVPIPYWIEFDHEPSLGGLGIIAEHESLLKAIYPSLF
jgi:hypothetical protein